MEVSLLRLILVGFGLDSLGMLWQFVVCDMEANGYCLSRFKSVPESEMTQEQRLLYRLMRTYDRASRPVYDATKPVIIRLGISLTQVLDMMTQEQRLLYRIIRTYDRASRPVYDATKPVITRLGISLTQVLDMDEKNQILTTNVWLDQEWIDERLIWNNVSDFSSIGMLRIPCDLLWLPDIVLYNSVDNHNKGYMKSLAMVAADGNVFWPPIVRMRSSCKMDITYFPFDDQICMLKLGSWAYDGLQVDVTNRTVNIDLNNFVDNGEWTLIDTKVKRNVKFYPCCPEPFPDVMFYLHLRRRVLYYFFNVIIPCMLLSTLTLTGFLLPPDSGEKITLGLTVLLAFSVFMLLIAENMPPTSEYVPLIGIYLTVIMAMSALSVVFSVFVLNFHHRGSLRHGPPCWIKSATTFVSSILCTRVHFSDRSVIYQTKPHATYGGYLSNNGYNALNLNDQEPTSTQTEINSNLDEAGLSEAHKQMQYNSCIASKALDSEILHYFDKVLTGIEKSIEDSKSANDWREVARVMDKVFFVIFLFITVTSTVVLLVLCPMTKEISIDDKIV